MNAPKWTESISSETICGYYYVMFIVACIIVGIAFIGLFGILFSKMPMMMKMTSSMNILVSGGLAVLGAMFLYIMCDRALLPQKKN